MSNSAAAAASRTASASASATAADAASPLVSSALPDADILREVRAYEHARQRAKRAEEVARRRAVKEQSLTALGNQLSQPTPRSKKGAGAAPSYDSVGVENLAAPPRDDVAHGPAPSRPAGMRLDDLVRVAAPAKPRKSKRKDVGFEMVPPVRSVIALDDTTSRDVVIDEPWEYIPRDNEVPKASYAAILGA